MSLHKTETDYAAERHAIFEKLGLSVAADFVPFSRSRHRDNKQPSINWRVTISRGGRSMVVDYSQGVGHIPNYSHQFSRLVVYDDAVREACENGKSRIIKHKNGYDAAQGVRIWKSAQPLPPPTREDVLYCLVLDASVLDCPRYEDWAGEFGYDTDSRRGEAIYRECLQQALELRALIGDEYIEKLREAYQDY